MSILCRSIGPSLAFLEFSFRPDMSRTHPPTNEPNYQPCNTNFVKRLGCRPSPINEKTLSGKVWQATAKNIIIKLFLLSGHLPNCDNQQSFNNSSCTGLGKDQSGRNRSGIVATKLMVNKFKCSTCFLSISLYLCVVCMW